MQQQTRLDYRGKYSGDVVRDDTVAFIAARPPNATARPYFLYVAFQEAHAPFQVDTKYLELYPHLASTPEQQALAGMITHTDAMVGDIIDALNSSGALPHTLVIFSSDNGGPMAEVLEGLTPPQRFDPHVIDRNYPFRGQKHEMYEGGVRVAGFVYAPGLLASRAGGTVESLFHVSDWVRAIPSKWRPFSHQAPACLQPAHTACPQPAHTACPRSAHTACSEGRRPAPPAPVVLRSCLHWSPRRGRRSPHALTSRSTESTNGRAYAASASAASARKWCSM